MSSVKKVSWMVAASVGMVEALKDQGYARWNYPIRCLHSHAKSKLRSFSQNKMLSSPATAGMVSRNMAKEEKVKKSEESLKTVMYLSCWGPN